MDWAYENRTKTWSKGNRVEQQEMHRHFALRQAVLRRVQSAGQLEGRWDIAWARFTWDSCVSFYMEEIECMSTTRFKNWSGQNRSTWTMGTGYWKGHVWTKDSAIILLPVYSQCLAEARSSVSPGGKTIHLQIFHHLSSPRAFEGTQLSCGTSELFHNCQAWQQAAGSDSIHHWPSTLCGGHCSFGSQWLGRKQKILRTANVYMFIVDYMT